MALGAADQGHPRPVLLPHHRHHPAAREAQQLALQAARPLVPARRHRQSVARADALRRYHGPRRCRDVLHPPRDVGEAVDLQRRPGRPGQGPHHHQQPHAPRPPQGHLHVHAPRHPEGLRPGVRRARPRAVPAAAPVRGARRGVRPDALPGLLREPQPVRHGAVDGHEGRGGGPRRADPRGGQGELGGDAPPDAALVLERQHVPARVAALRRLRLRRARHEGVRPEGLQHQGGDAQEGPAARDEAARLPGPRARLRRPRRAQRGRDQGGAAHAHLGRLHHHHRPAQLLLRHRLPAARHPEEDPRGAGRGVRGRPDAAHRLRRPAAPAVPGALHQGDPAPVPARVRDRARRQGGLEAQEGLHAAQGVHRAGRPVRDAKEPRVVPGPRALRPRPLPPRELHRQAPLRLRAVQRRFPELRRHAVRPHVHEDADGERAAPLHRAPEPQRAQDPLRHQRPGRPVHGAGRRRPGQPPTATPAGRQLKCGERNPAEMLNP